jgi:hypothetical protein
MERRTVSLQPEGLAENSQWQAQRRYRIFRHTPEKVADNVKREMDSISNHQLSRSQHWLLLD